MPRNDHQWGNLWDPFTPNEGGWNDLRDRKYVEINQRLKKGVDSDPAAELPLSSEGDNNENAGNDTE